MRPQAVAFVNTARKGTTPESFADYLKHREAILAAPPQKVEVLEPVEAPKPKVEMKIEEPKVEEDYVPPPVPIP